jgi:hypothetical protein
MNERNLKIENSRLRREIVQLKKELADIRQNKPPVSESKIIQTSGMTDKQKYDPFNPCPNDPVFNGIRAQHQQKPRSWLNIT